VVREGVRAGGEMTQALYEHINNKTIKIKQTNKNKVFERVYRDCMQIRSQSFKEHL
jgi:hypothetical protein